MAITLYFYTKINPIPLMPIAFQYKKARCTTIYHALAGKASYCFRSVITLLTIILHSNKQSREHNNKKKPFSYTCNAIKRFARSNNLAPPRHEHAQSTSCKMRKPIKSLYWMGVCVCVCVCVWESVRLEEIEVILRLHPWACLWLLSRRVVPIFSCLTSAQLFPNVCT